MFKCNAVDQKLPKTSLKLNGCRKYEFLKDKITFSDEEITTKYDKIEFVDSLTDKELSFILHMCDIIINKYPAPKIPIDKEIKDQFH